MFERSSKLQRCGYVHGFTDRQGGVSSGRFATLNMGGKWGDAPDAVARNRLRVSEAAGFDLATLCLIRQVHGVEVVRAATIAAATEGDAVWSHRDDGPYMSAVLTADCVPILLGDSDGSIAAAVHSGWRGTAANIVGATVERLVSAAGVARESLIAAIGPCIEVEAFEVGPEVVAYFDPAFVVHRAERTWVDLVGAVRRQLIDAGVPEASIERVGGCTFAHPDRYFSYRRDGAGIGQMMAFIGLPATRSTSDSDALALAGEGAEPVLETGLGAKALDRAEDAQS